MEKLLGVALVNVGRVGTGGGTPLVTLHKIGGGPCEELVRRQKHSGHIVAETHLTGVRAMDREWLVQMGAEIMRKCRGEGLMQCGPRVGKCISVLQVRRVEAALTCSEDEMTVTQVLSLSQEPTSASSSASSTEVSDLRTPRLHSLSCWLPLFVDAVHGVGSCR